MATLDYDRATKAVAPAAVDWHLGSLMIWHLVGEATDDTLALGEVVVRPGLEPPLHIHAREDETWFVIDGEVVFQRGLELLTLRSGEAIFLPRGVAHGFAVRSETARMLHVYSPAGLEDGHREASVPAERRELPPAPVGPPTEEQMQAAGQAYASRGVTFVGPPLSVVLAGG
jgi:quercetin dioxygenase-like cupin family protein